MARRRFSILTGDYLEDARPGPARRGDLPADFSDWPTENLERYANLLQTSIDVHRILIEFFRPAGETSTTPAPALAAVPEPTTAPTPAPEVPANLQHLVERSGLPAEQASALVSATIDALASGVDPGEFMPEHDAAGALTGFRGDGGVSLRITGRDPNGRIGAFEVVDQDGNRRRATVQRDMDNRIAGVQFEGVQQ